MTGEEPGIEVTLERWGRDAPEPRVDALPGGRGRKGCVVAQWLQARRDGLLARQLTSRIRSVALARANRGPITISAG